MHAFIVILICLAYFHIPAWSASLEEGKAAFKAGDYKSAVGNFQSAAEKGNPEAIFELAKCYQHGRGVRQDAVIALSYFKDAAERGNTGAACYLWGLYRGGKSVPKDLSKSMQWLHFAASHNDTLALTILGGMYYKGSPEDNVAIDFLLANRFFQKAAFLGNNEAQANLCAIYLDGRGVPKDLVESYAWCLIAQENPGIYGVSEMMTKLEKRLSSAEMSKAQKRSARLRQKIRNAPGH